MPCREAVHATEDDGQGKGAVAAHLALGVALGAALRQWPLPFPEGEREQLTQEALAALTWVVEHDPKSPRALYSLACVQVCPASGAV
jgi:hypothetical protein